MAAGVHLGDSTGQPIIAYYVGDGQTSAPQGVVSVIYLGDQQVYP